MDRKFFAGIAYFVLLLTFPPHAYCLGIVSEFPWKSIFAGVKTNFPVKVVGEHGASVSLRWKLAVNGRIVCRGESSLLLDEEGVGRKSLLINAPQLDSAIKLTSTLLISAQNNHRDGVELEQQFPLDLYGPNLLAAGAQFDAGLPHINLFDPVGTTSQDLNAVHLPFKRISRNQLSENDFDGLLVIGEGVALQRYRGMSELLIKLAAEGKKILLLQPVAGSLPLASIQFSDKYSMPELSLNSYRAYSQFAAEIQWAELQRQSGFGIVLDGSRSAVTIRFVESAAHSWRWLSVYFPDSKGRFIVSMLPFSDYLETIPQAQGIFGELLVFAAGSAMEQTDD